MDTHEKNVVGVYDTEQEAIAAIDELLKRGYSQNEISVIGKHVNHVTEETGAAVEESAATGAIAGGAIGGVTGLLAGAGALAIPGIGPLIAAGPIATSFVGAVTGAGLGGLTGALVGMGIPDEEAEYYENSIKEGKILVLVENGSDDHLNDRNYLHDHMEDSTATLVAGHPKEVREHKEDEFISEKRPFSGAGYKSRVMGSTIDENIDMESGAALDEVAAIRESGSTLDNRATHRESGSTLTRATAASNNSCGSSLKGGSTPIEKANNSSMARDYEEVERLGNEMEEAKTEPELRTEHLKPDPMQSEKLIDEHTNTSKSR
ncbi:general stress protein [Neobacillus niacini]|uniref:general stress protein n=1 Tax=Neobacillus niacini TaxID=86668 RepID=UPI0021CB4ED1|nr:general stress protein [Neobacillus niacini]MCM3764001.1 general stress protein [Neobacillus niacini]